MIKIFRNIRKSLLNEGKTGKYFRYAIGEIILVVIGILIALQVNNWNNNINSRNEEKMAILEIYQSLKFEFEDVIPYQVNRSKILEQGITTFLNLREEKVTISDTVFERLWDEINMGSRFTYESGPFEAVKNRGLNLISNDSVRAMLVNLYETTFPRSQYFINSYLDSQDYSVQSIKLKEFLLKTEVYKNAKGDWSFKNVFRDHDMLYSEEFLEYLSIKKESCDYFQNHMVSVNLKIEKVLKAMRLELNTF